MGYNETLEQVDGVLADYNTSYIDLMLIHWPTSNGHSTDPACNSGTTAAACRLSTYRGLLTALNAGKVG